MNFSHFPHSLLPKLFVVGAALALLLALACGSDPTPTPEPTATPPPTATPVPTPTSTPEPTPTPTRAPTATPTPAPTATPGVEETETTSLWRPSESLLPEGVGMVAEVYPATVLGPSSPLVGMIGALGGEADGDVDGLVEEFQESTGIDLLSVTFAEMFTDVDALLGSGLDLDSGEVDFGMALYGEFDGEDIVASFGRDDDLEYEVGDYRGYTLYLIHDGGGPPMSVSIIDADTVLIGTASSVEAMLDVADGASSSLSGGLREALDSLGDRHLGFAIELPPELLEEMVMGTEGEEGMPQMGLLGAMDMTALTAPVNAMKVLFEDDTMHITASSFFDDSVAATASKEYSEGVIAMLGAVFASSEELRDFASGMEVSQSGDIVTFEMSITAQVIEELFASLGTMMMPQN